jgi:hypothetical protein
MASVRFMTSAQEDKCKDVLDKLYNTTQMTSSGDFTSDLHNWLLSDKLKEWLTKQKSGFILGIPTDGSEIGLGVNSSESSYQKLRDYLNSAKKEYITQKFYNTVASQIINNESVDAWRECMKMKSNGIQRFYGDIDYETPNGFVITLGWQSDLNVSSIKVEKPTIVGGSCMELKEGIIIDRNGKKFYVKRDSDREFVTVIVNAQNNFGSVTKLVPPFKKDEDPNSLQYLEKACWDGDSNSCLRLSTELTIKCKQDYPNQNQQPNRQLMGCIEYAQNIQNRGFALDQLKNCVDAFGKTSPCYFENIQNIERMTQGLLDEGRIISWTNIGTVRK